MKNDVNKIWTINVQVNTNALVALKKKGTWENPEGSKQSWDRDVKITAINNKDVQVVTGTGAHFDLKVDHKDTVRWVLSEVDPTVNSRDMTVCMYGFKQGSNWVKCFTGLSVVAREIQVATIKNYAFNSPQKPKDPYFETHDAEMSVPETTVKVNAPSGVIVTYFIKLLLINSRTKSVENFIQIDPKLTIQ